MKKSSIYQTVLVYGLVGCESEFNESAFMFGFQKAFEDSHFKKVLNVIELLVQNNTYLLTVS
jgi:hypothetical protein